MKKIKQQPALFFHRAHRAMSFLPIAKSAALYFLPFLFYGFKLWMDKNFGGSGTMEMVAVFLMFGLESLAGGPSIFIINGILLMSIMPLTISLLLAVLDRWLLLYFKNTASNAHEIKRIDFLYKVIKSLLVITLFLSMGGMLWRALNGNEFMKMHFTSTANQPDYFQQTYIDPKNVTITPPARRKNLVPIYVESLEDSYKDPAFYGRNLMATMTPVEQQGFLFAMRTTGPALETLPGHIASQCGLPMVSIFFTNITNGQNRPTVLQNTLCLSDILARHGYHNVFMQSSTIYTGGIGIFYDLHHFNERQYLEYWKTRGYGIGPSDKQGPSLGPWGLFDKDILDESYKKLQSLQAGRQTIDQPFSLIIATIDIHAPAASRCTLGQKKPPFDKVVECTSAALAEFITNAKKNGLLQDTELYIMGDHRIVAVSGVDMKEWNKTYPHREPYAFLYGKHIAPKRRAITHYDIFPTLLELLGFTIAGHRLGFGYSAMAEIPNYPTPAQWDKIMTEATQPSKKYLSLWARPDDAFKEFMRFR